MSNRGSEVERTHHNGSDDRTGDIDGPRVVVSHQIVVQWRQVNDHTTECADAVDYTESRWSAVEFV